MEGGSPEEDEDSQEDESDNENDSVGEQEETFDDSMVQLISSIDRFDKLIDWSIWFQYL